jgi:hypothetical protein
MLIAARLRWERFTARLHAVQTINALGEAMNPKKAKQISADEMLGKLGIT